MSPWSQIIVVVVIIVVITRNNTYVHSRFPASPSKPFNKGGFFFLEQERNRHISIGSSNTFMQLSLRLIFLHSLSLSHFHEHEQSTGIFILVFHLHRIGSDHIQSYHRFASTCIFVIFFPILSSPIVAENETAHNWLYEGIGLPLLRIGKNTFNVYTSYTIQQPGLKD